MKKLNNSNFATGEISAEELIEEEVVVLETNDVITTQDFQKVMRLENGKKIKINVTLRPNSSL